MWRLQFYLGIVAELFPGMLQNVTRSLIIAYLPHLILPDLLQNELQTELL